MAKEARVEKEMNQKPNVVWKEFSEIKYHPKNPRLHPIEQIRKLEDSLTTYGDGKLAISYQKATGYILTGHGLIEAKRERGEIGAWMVELDFTDGKALAWMIADNKLGELSAWDPAILNADFAELEEMPDVELEDTMFELEEIRTPNFQSVDEAEQPRLDQKSPITCPECGYEFIPKS